ncbi:hypothetical protein R3W88_026966 [Solanum pinnatisectum]|uniref:Defensin-like protein n=1 Tax=Solanum pinnatisectum TaxID=50273 RepID=A0AAV9LFX1_9SOLN|nr:hypothetical protein R3W88_026966 [Solanum pinnatisectum]
MPKFLNFALCFLLIILAALGISQVNAQHRCTKILYLKGCILYDCKNECSKKDNGNGLCSSSGTICKYVCTCLYNCNLNESNFLN